MWKWKAEHCLLIYTFSQELIDFLPAWMFSFKWYWSKGNNEHFGGNKPIKSHIDEDFVLLCPERIFIDIKLYFAFYFKRFPQRCHKY